METIRDLVEAYLRGRFGYEGHRATRMLAATVLVGALIVFGVWLIPNWLTIPRISSEGPVVRNGVAAIVVCGEKRGYRPLEKAMHLVPEPRTGSWGMERRDGCNVYYHRPPGLEQSHNRHERAEHEQAQ